MALGADRIAGGEREQTEVALHRAGIAPAGETELNSSHGASSSYSAEARAPSPSCAHSSAASVNVIIHWLFRDVREVRCGQTPPHSLGLGAVAVGGADQRQSESPHWTYGSASAIWRSCCSTPPGRPIVHESVNSWPAAISGIVDSSTS